MTIRTIVLAAFICGAAAAQSPAPYSAIEVDPFVADRGVALPADYQRALVEDIAREASLIFTTVIILRQGDAAPFGHAVLRISGTLIKFDSGNKLKKSLIGFGAGATSAQAQVRLADASSGQVLLIREVKGSPDSLGRRIVKLCNANRLVGSN